MKNRFLTLPKHRPDLSQLRALAGQTAIYGLSSIVGRLLNYLLVPLYTRIFSPGDYGIVSEFYAYITFFMVIYSLGLETAFFHFSNKKLKQENVYGNAQLALTIISVSFTLLLLLFSDTLSQKIGYGNHPQYLRYMALILLFDTLSNLPFARLRQQNKALRFALIKLGGIFVNIGLNLFLLVVLSDNDTPTSDTVGYVFLANLVASAGTLLLLIPELKGMQGPYDKKLIREMLVYGFPLLIAGFAGMINETLDRAILKYLVTDPSIAMEQLGIYSACYKLSILMTLFVQTFRYAADPFYFSQQHKENAHALFATVMNYFVLAGCIIFLGVMFYLDIIKLFIGEKFHSGLKVVPVLLAANLFLGIYLNLSICYKLTGKTYYGAWLSIFGAIITIVFNIWLIPKMGYMGAAWATFICYLTMMLLSYLKGRELFPVPYDLRRLLVMMITAGVLWYFFDQFERWAKLSSGMAMALGTILLLGYIGSMWQYIGGKSALPLLLRKKD